MGVALSFLRAFKPHKLILNGDIIDASQLSTKFDKDPANRNTIYDDIEETKSWLGEIKHLFKRTEIFYNFGNHEERMRKYAWRVAPEVYEILNLENLLELDKMNIGYNLSDSEVYDLGELIVVHGNIVSKKSGYTAMRNLEHYQKSVIHNHSHRLGSVYSTSYAGGKGAWENGCLCKFELAKKWGKSYPPNWQQGLSVVYIKGKRFDVKPIYISKGQLLFGGKEYE